MGIEQAINEQLNKYPKLKKIVKRLYQRVNCLLFAPKRSDGEINRISPDTGEEFFFGYYDKSPEDITGRFVLCLKADDTWTSVAPQKEAEILLIDREVPENDPARVKVIGKTHTWNVQQGCMLQWLGPDFSERILYNDFRGGKYCSVILNVKSCKEEELCAPVYAVSQDGTFALTLDFSRLHRLRPGYGYSNLPDLTRDQKCPDAPAISYLDILKNKVHPILHYSDFAEFEPREEMANAEHKVNHIMLSPNGKRFMVLHRWFKGERKYTRLVTANVDGTDLYNLSDDDMVSHCFWKDNETVLAFENKKGLGSGYYLMKDKTQDYKRLWPDIGSDGHPSFSPDGRLVLTDTYPNRKRIAVIKILNENFSTVVARVYAPFKYDNETRCDLHPRWSRDGKRVYFDSVFEGHRGLYMVDVSHVNFAYGEVTGKALKSHELRNDRVRIVFLMTSCKRVGPSQQTLNIIKYLDQERFEPILITLNDEDLNSRLREFLPYVTKHYLVKTGKKDILIGHDYRLREKLEEIHPDVIHTVGVFPDYAVSRIKKYRQVHTLRNYIYDDYPAKYGKVRGFILAWLQLYAMKHSDIAVTCSSSLSRIYEEKLNLHYDYIRNGVDTDQYVVPTKEEKTELRKTLNLPLDAFIYIYTGQFIKRKNIPFLMKGYTSNAFNRRGAFLLLLGEGEELERLKNQYEEYGTIRFQGNVSNVEDYLKASDVYVSTSKSEGLPNGALEAMATGLPVILSDIEQHKELFEVSDEIGMLYRQDDLEDFILKMEEIREVDHAIQYGEKAYEIAHQEFNAKGMSKRYQVVYRSVVERKQENGKKN